MPCPPWRPSPSRLPSRPHHLAGGGRVCAFALRPPGPGRGLDPPRLRPAEFFSGSNPAALRRLVRQLRARPFDLVVDVQGLLKSAVWVALARGPRKVGYDKTRELSYLALSRAGGAV